MTVCEPPGQGALVPSTANQIESEQTRPASQATPQHQLLCLEDQDFVSCLMFDVCYGLLRP